MFSLTEMNRFLLVAVAALMALPAAVVSSPREVQVLLSSDTEIYAAGLNGIQSALDAPIRIQYLDALAPDEAGLSAYFGKLESAGQTAMIVTVGTRATRAAFRHVNKLPVVFSMVSAPRTLGDRISLSCGVSMDVPVERFFETLKEISPKARNVVAFHSTAQGEFLAGEGDYSDLKNGLYFKKVKVAERSDLAGALDELRGKVDALYLVADPLYDRLRFRQISEFSRKNNIVLMTSFGSLVQAGATFALTPDYFRLGVLTGEMAQRILQGKSDCHKEAVQYADRISLYVNEKYARESGVEIPAKVRKRASLTRLMNAGIRLFNQGRFRSARKVFEAVLAKDPGNRAASSYRSRIIERETGEETARLLQAAAAAKKQQRYGDALAAYQRILEVNPSHRTATALLTATRKEKSESERQDGDAAAKRGDPFRALRHYQEAIRTLPSNEAAQQALQRLRAAQGAQVPVLYQKGLEAYNSRHYAEALNLLGNVLLIQPGHRQAQEYLRLSLKKKAAIERLLQRRQAKNR